MIGVSTNLIAKMTTQRGSFCANQASFLSDLIGFEFDFVRLVSEVYSCLSKHSAEPA